MLKICSNLKKNGQCSKKKLDLGYEKCPAVTTMLSDVQTIDYNLMSKMACSDKWNIPICGHCSQPIDSLPECFNCNHYLCKNIEKMAEFEKMKKCD
jgi:hypothetical protein